MRIITFIGITFIEILGFLYVPYWLGFSILWVGKQVGLGWNTYGSFWTMWMFGCPEILMVFIVACGFIPLLTLNIKFSKWIFNFICRNSNDQKP